jgi:hypothetical protein
MTTKTIIITLAAIGTLSAAMPAEARVNQRQDRQQTRIVKGIHNDSLTVRETKALAKQQASIRKYERRSRADGNGLSLVERARLEQRQDRASRNIYRQKHD